MHKSFRSAYPENDSVLQKALSLFKRLLLTAVKEGEELIINVLMRRCVKWYDKKHNLTSNPEPGTEPPPIPQSESSIQKESTDDCNEMVQLREENTSLKQELEDCKDQIYQMALELDNIVSSYNNLLNECASLRMQVEEFKTLNLAAQQPDKPIQAPSQQQGIEPKVLYAQGDVEGEKLIKIKSKDTPESLYEIKISSEKADIGEFCVVDRQEMIYVIDNRSLMLKACEITSISSAPTRIITEKPGKVKLKNGQWIIINRALIKLI